MEQVAFFAGAIGALGGAIAVIALRNPFYSVLALVVHLFSLAGLFLLLHAEFVAAAQVVVYAGAVMVLYVFVVAYVGDAGESAWEPIPGFAFRAALAIGADELNLLAQGDDRILRRRRLAGDVWSVLIPNMLLMLAVGGVFFGLTWRKLRKRVD